MVVRGKKVFLISRLGKCGGSTCGPLGTATRHQHNLELPQQQQRRLSPAWCQQPAASSPAATAPPSKPIQSWAANISGSLIWPEMGRGESSLQTLVLQHRSVGGGVTEGGGMITPRYYHYCPASWVEMIATS